MVSYRQAGNRKGHFKAKESPFKTLIENNVSRRDLYRRPRNFPKAAGVIMDTGRNLTVRDLLDKAKDAFLERCTV